LELFGDHYKEGAEALLRVLAISGLGVALGAMINFVFKQTKNLKAMILTTGSNAISTIVLSIVLIGPFGLPGIGWALIISGLISLVIGGYFMLKTFNSPSLKYMVKW
jgi:Na+-driven multidrug efflux pump